MKTFHDAIRSCDFVLTAQLPLFPGTTAADVRRSVETLQPVVSAVQISDNLTTRPHMSPVAAAAIVLQAGMDPVVQLTCRDRNRIALQSDLMGAAALGITSFVLSRGEKLPAAHKQRIKGVFDIGAQRLIATAQAISANERLVAPPGFFLGANITVIDPPTDWSPEGLDGKADAGSKFVQTQPCLDVDVLTKYMAALVGRKTLERVSVMVQIPLLGSMEELKGMQEGRRPLLIRPNDAARLERTADFAQEAAAIFHESLQAAKAVPGVSGANILHQGDAVAVVRALRMFH